MVTYQVYQLLMVATLKVRLYEHCSTKDSVLGIKCSLPGEYRLAAVGNRCEAEYYCNWERISHRNPCTGKI